jgi:hypothetical protein
MTSIEYYTLTNLVVLFVGQTRNSVGKALKELEMRTPRYSNCHRSTFSPDNWFKAQPTQEPVR